MTALPPQFWTMDATSSPRLTIPRDAALRLVRDAVMQGLTSPKGPITHLWGYEIEGGPLDVPKEAP